MLSSAYQSTDNPLVSTLYEPLSKHLISVLGPTWYPGRLGKRGKMFEPFNEESLALMTFLCF